ncbi:breast carcinoma-amplified sequence 1 isoform X3 [Carlito syrichta]|uniref:Breast carcinoma-amplified sequence 1 isoform X3 n=1 Tax=Carlito syrichta TaxID=1868482 RepID=A0A3Q0EEH9_CARSF|nr:breast carcinoma-amplified sequence 1 isoform X3 [Carlito syrichta]
MFVFTVDLGISVKRDNVATSSPKTMEISPVADANRKNLGTDAKPEAPAAKSRFFLTLSRPVPVRTGDQATDSSTGSVRLDVSSNNAPANKDPSEHWALPVAAALGQDADKTPGHPLAQEKALSATGDPASLPPETGGAAPSKPKDSSFFDKIFKLDKRQEKAPIDSQQETKRAEHPDEGDRAPGSSGLSNDVPDGEDIVDSKEERREIGTESVPIPGDPEGQTIAKEDPQTTAITEDNNSIMSFFKTLVSPNKAETKKDPEDTASKATSVCDGQAGQKTSGDQAKGTKKKHLDSPRLGLAFRKFFRHKGVEKSPTTSADLKSDQANFIPQETQGAAKNPKGCNPSGHAPSVTSAETAKEGTKEKSGPTSLPLGKLFWKKTSDSTEKAVTPPEPEPTGAVQKGKEGPSKDKKAAAETNKQKNHKQEAKEPAQCTEQATADANSLQNGDKPQKRPEKQQQSFRGFLKGLGPKRMLDAQVQTDPVSIGPVGKSK